MDQGIKIEELQIEKDQKLFANISNKTDVNSTNNAGIDTRKQTYADVEKNEELKINEYKIIYNSKKEGKVEQQ